MSIRPDNPQIKTSNIRTIGFLIYDGVSPLDFTGPAEAFSRSNGYELIYLSPSGGNIHTASGITIADTLPATSINPATLDTLIITGSDSLPPNPFKNFAYRRRPPPRMRPSPRRHRLHRGFHPRRARIIKRKGGHHPLEKCSGSGQAISPNSRTPRHHPCPRRSFCHLSWHHRRHRPGFKSDRGGPRSTHRQRYRQRHGGLYAPPRRTIPIRHHHRSTFSQPPQPSKSH